MTYTEILFSINPIFLVSEFTGLLRMLCSNRVEVEFLNKWLTAAVVQLLFYDYDDKYVIFLTVYTIYKFSKPENPWILMRQSRDSGLR